MSDLNTKAIRERAEKAKAAPGSSIRRRNFYRAALTDVSLLVDALDAARAEVVRLKGEIPLIEELAHSESQVAELRRALDGEARASDRIVKERDAARDLLNSKGMSVSPDLDMMRLVKERDAARAELKIAWADCDAGRQVSGALPGVVYAGEPCGACARCVDNAIAKGNSWQANSLAWQERAEKAETERDAARAELAQRAAEWKQAQAVFLASESELAQAKAQAESDASQAKLTREMREERNNALQESARMREVARRAEAHAERYGKQIDGLMDVGIAEARALGITSAIVPREMVLGAIEALKAALAQVKQEREMLREAIAQNADHDADCRRIVLFGEYNKGRSACPDEEDILDKCDCWLRAALDGTKETA